ncbi:hypothetical protein NHX12_027902 [Muraenolepis orangiensis]|uniref:Protein transport protein Sec31A n=1 Tax=Muraenolepis orangiensis TaxID=630683 RepID=A0A9Q0IPA9_9TELE|nr:hypothetical protein NHX12_027902 [Muraenolepis orangiensis]
MKLKEVNRTAVQSWSPTQQHPIYLATGTSAQQLDASFSTNASLEIFEVDLADPSLDMKSCGTFSSSHRYHKLVWGPHGMDEAGHPTGILIAGGENGDVIVYDPSKIMAGDDDVIITQSDKHTGPVRALDVNPFQANLVASGGNDSEIYIWDLNNFGSPMTPGPKTQPLEDISCVAWNRQVQHILASASPSGRASVWDLRKNDLIIKVSDHSNRMHCSGLAWNPEVATQLVLSSEDDRMPVIQMWDLRFATSPLKILENHTRGVLAIAWSVADPELLLSCGKDNRILCWNPDTAEVLYELPTSTQWCFDIQWCPRNPAVLSAASFDGNISLYSIMGGSNQAQSQRQADQISNSFGNMDPFGTGQTLPPLPVGASFAFGGKLVTLDNAPSNPQQPAKHVVHVSQVVTETAFLARSDQLQATLSGGGNFGDFCQGKMDAAQHAFEKTIWSFLKVHFDSDVRGKYLELLGYKKEELAAKISTALKEMATSPIKPEVVPVVLQPAVAPVVLQPAVAPAASSFPAFPPADISPEAVFDLISAANLQPADDTAADVGLPEEAEPAEEIPVTREDSVEVPDTVPPAQGGVHLTVSQDVDGLITQALLTGDFEGAVELCLHDNRMADSIILAIAGGPELLERTQKKYFSNTHTKLTKLISAVVLKDWTDILTSCDLANWKEALAAVMTYSRPEELSAFCDLLGGRLEASQDVLLQAQASLCYICAGNVEKVVWCWTQAPVGHSPLSLQDLVEKVVVLRQAVERAQGGGGTDGGVLLEEMMGQYASLLASQGSLATAMAYLSGNTSQSAPAQQNPYAGGVPRPLYNPGQPSQAAVAPQPGPVPRTPVPTPTSTPLQPQYYQPMRAASTVTSWSNQTPTALPNIPPAQLASGPQQQNEPLPPPPNSVHGMPIPGAAAPAASAPPPASSTPGYMYSHQYQRPQNGWNDPPALTRATKKKGLENYTPPAPITAPIMGLPGSDSQGQPMSPISLQGSTAPGQGPFSGRQQQLPPMAGGHPAMPQTSGEGPPGAPTGDMVQPMQSIPAEKILKKPIPEEHLVLKTTFEGLIQKCLAVASDPQTKRKLDDASKRLEALYDKLREQSLSPAIVGGLHNMARSIESRAYADSLNIHTHIVSSSNFSETSAFMPVLKVVLTQANKLGV